MVKFEPSIRKSIWRLGVRSRLGLGLNCLQATATACAKTLHDFCRVRFFSRRTKKGSAGRVDTTRQADPVSFISRSVLSPESFRPFYALWSRFTNDVMLCSGYKVFCDVFTPWHH